MKNQTLLCALASATLVVACATPPPSPPPPPPVSMRFVQSDCPDTFSPKQEDSCQGNGCFIWVEVVWNAQAQTCEVVVGTENMHVRGPQNEKVTIRWLMPESPKFEFRVEPPQPPPVFATPIFFKTPNASTQFSNLNVTAKKVELDDHRTAPGPYKYGVRVYHKVTGEKLDSPDPSLYNDF